jgi:hypothetical protein
MSNLVVKDVKLVEDESCHTGWRLIMDGGDGTTATIGEIALWEKILKQNATIISLTERVRGIEAIKSIKKVASDVERMSVD